MTAWPCLHEQRSIDADLWADYCDYDYCPNCGSPEWSFPVVVWDDEGHTEKQCPACGEPQ